MSHHQSTNVTKKKIKTFTMSVESNSGERQKSSKIAKEESSPSTSSPLQGGGASYQPIHQLYFTEH